MAGIFHKGESILVIRKDKEENLMERYTYRFRYTVDGRLVTKFYDKATMKEAMDEFEEDTGKNPNDSSVDIRRVHT